MLTELRLLAEAVEEIHSLSDGEDDPLPHIGNTRAAKASVTKHFIKQWSSAYLHLNHVASGQINNYGRRLVAVGYI